jgi:hypothetical protein
MYHTAVEQLRKEAQRLYLVHEAIEMLLGMVTIESRKGLEKSREAINDTNKRRLRDIIAELRERIKEDKEKHGIKVSNTELLNLLNQANAQKGNNLLLPKYYLAKLVLNFHLLMPKFKEFPEHLKIAIDPGIYRTKEGNFELFLVEGIMFEDMCVLFNLAKEYNTKNNIETPKRIFKTGQAFLRSAVTTAYYLVEAYLNGIAFDHYIKNKDGLDEESKTLLTEWDYRTNRPRYISLKDKLVKYPRIILGVQHSPLQPNNCPEMEFIMGRAKIIRDSIVHSSPAIDSEAIEIPKEKEFFQLNFNDMEEIVDKSISLIRKMEIAIFGNVKRLFWLYERGKDGFFPDDVFI